jgi:hypothetical protein
VSADMPFYHGDVPISYIEAPKWVYYVAENRITVDNRRLFISKKKQLEAGCRRPRLRVPSGLRSRQACRKPLRNALIYFLRYRLVPAGTSERKDEIIERIRSYVNTGLLTLDEVKLSILAFREYCT